MAVPPVSSLPDAFDALLKESQAMSGGLGALAFGVLQLMKKGGMPENELAEVRRVMNQYFQVPTDETCNLVLRVVERRLVDDRISLADGIHRWY